MQNPGVEHIYALNRYAEDGTPLLQRQKARLRDWGFDTNIMESPKVTFIEAHMSTERLGMSKEMYEKVRTSITHIIHNGEDRLPYCISSLSLNSLVGYRVNFNLSLTSFEPNVRTVRYMIDLALSSPFTDPPRLEFVSSVGVLSHHKRDGPIKEASVDPSCAIGNGYTQSKWVNEQLLSIAAKDTPLKTVSVRVGQVTGGVSGAWNRAEWFPTLVMSGQYLSCLPTLDKEISWIPVDAVAQSLIEMRNSKYPVLHLAHPRSVSWNTVIAPIAKDLKLPLVSYDEWVSSLEKSGENLTAEKEVEMMKVNPALRILEFFSLAKWGEGSKEAFGLPELDMSKAQEVAPALNEENLKQLNERDALAWLAYW